MLPHAAARALALIALMAPACSNSDAKPASPAAPAAQDAEAEPEQKDAAEELDDAADGDETDGEAGPCVPADASVPDPPMVFVPSGQFWMGCDEGSDPACTVGETPPHAVTLSAFWIDRHEVTMGEYQACVQACACSLPAASFTPQDTPDLPVVEVDFLQAQTYCAWLGRALPTEAQWEKAARSADGRHYPWGNEQPDCVRAAYLGCALDGQSGVPFPAGTFSPQGDSSYGAQEMAGNVWEWVADWYAPYPTGAITEPKGPDDTGIRIWRGGSYLSDASSLRVAHRLPEQTPHYHALGFRCAM
jgi:formylglycine-generating enzyme required for sulfatase activity